MHDTDTASDAALEEPADAEVQHQPAATDSTNASATMLHDVAPRCQLRPVADSTSGNAPSRYGFAEPSMSLQQTMRERDTRHDRETRETESALGDPTTRATVLLPSGVCSATAPT